MNIFMFIPVVILSFSFISCSKSSSTLNGYNESAGIVGGRIATEQDKATFYTVGIDTLFEDFDGTRRHAWCSGGIIGDQTIITAAHCLAGHKIIEVNIVFSLDMSPSYTKNNPSSISKATKWIIHPDYKGIRDMYNDIAIIKIERIGDGYSIPELIISRPSLLKEERFFIGGYGKFDPNTSSTDGRMRIGEALFSRYTPFGTIEAKSSNGTLTCNGDSGSPVYLDYSGEYRILAIVTHGSNDCIQKAYYLPLHLHAAFISEHLYN